MKNMRRAIEFILRITICAIFFMVTGCAEIRLNSISDPPQTNMLRVSIIPVTGHRDQNRGSWAIPEREFAEISYIHTAKLLHEIGFYEIISQEDVRRATGGQEIDAWKWEKNGWQLAKDAGRSLHADYLLMVKREFLGLLSIKLVLINVLTGRQYEVFDHTVTSEAALSQRSAAVMQFRRQIGEAHREIFRQAKGDLLATAIRKGRLMPTEDMKKPPARETKLASVQKTPVTLPIGGDKGSPPTKELSQKSVSSLIRPPGESIVSMPQPSSKPALPLPSVPPPLTASKPPVMDATPALPKEPLPQRTFTDQPKVIAKIPLPPPSDLQGEDKRKDFEKRLGKEPQRESLLTEKTKLVVHDFDTIERLKVVSLILTEALREELFILGRFRLVNREDMMQVLQEHKLQQSGLVDENQAVQLGKWLAANESVTGRLAVLGNTYVLQAKRTDIQTLGTLGIGSLRCVLGHEDELLSGIADLARRLAGLHATPHGNK